MTTKDNHRKTAAEIGAEILANERAYDELVKRDRAKLEEYNQFIKSYDLLFNTMKGHLYMAEKPTHIN